MIQRFVILLLLLLPFKVLLAEEPVWNLAGIEIDKPISKAEFEARAKGSFGFLSAREPKLNMAEYAILEKFVPFLEDDPKFALEMIEGLTKNNKHLSASFDYMLGNMYVQSGRIEDAEAAFQKGIAKYPDYLRAWRALGMLYLHTDSLDNALNALTRSIQLGDTDPFTFGQIGFCFYQKKEYLSSLSAYTQAILYEPSNIRWIRGKIASLRGLNDFQQASVLLQEVVRKSPDGAEYWMELANSWMQLGQPVKAIACLEFLREAELQSKESLDLLGTLYVNESLYSQAQNIYESMISKGYAPRGSSLLRCARMLHGSGRAEEANSLVETYLARVDELDERERTSVQIYQVRVAVDAGEFQEAKRLVDDVLRESPMNGEALMLLGRLEYRLGDSVKALLTLEKATRISTVASEALVLQAQIMVESKSYTEALESLERALVLREDEWIQDYYDRVSLLSRRSESDRFMYSTLLEE